MSSCPECGGEIQFSRTNDDVSEYVCKSCGIVVEELRFEESGGRKPEVEKPVTRMARSGIGLRDKVDPSWRHLCQGVREDSIWGVVGTPSLALVSLLRNPFIGGRVYRDRTKPSRRSVKAGLDESFTDHRRADKTVLHGRVRRVVGKALVRFDELAGRNRKDPRRRRGLFTACLYVEAMIQCFEDLKILLAFAEVKKRIDEDGRVRRIFLLSKKQRQSIRQRLAKPKKLERWALASHVSRNCIRKRIVEIERETPDIGQVLSFVRRF